MSAGIDRPRPSYGEYATPEQVAKARGMSLEEYERHLASLAVPRTPEPAEPSVVPAASKPVVRRGRRNRFATTALLTFGLASVLLSIPGLLQLGDGMQAAFAQQGMAAYTSFALARTLGLVAIVAQLLVWLVALAASVTALRHGRVSWWIPLTAGVIAVLIVSAVAVAAVVADPAFGTFIGSIDGPG